MMRKRTMSGCLECGAETITPRSSYCSEHFEELLAKKIREDDQDGSELDRAEMAG